MNCWSKIASAGVLCLLVGLLSPVAAWADKGSGGGSGSGGSSGGSGSVSGSGSGHSGSSSSSGSSGSSGSHGSDDNSGSSSRSSRESRHGGSDDRTGSVPGSKDRADEDRAYDGGWHERIRNGRYELFDPDGRLVIRRAAKGSDVDRVR